jgi:hypothetical protein
MARSNNPADSWVIQDQTGKLVVVRDLRVMASTVWPQQELDATPRAWVECEGALSFTGNGSAVIE